MCRKLPGRSCGDLLNVIVRVAPGYAVLQAGVLLVDERHGDRSADLDGPRAIWPLVDMHVAAIINGE